MKAMPMCRACCSTSWRWQPWRDVCECGFCGRLLTGLELATRERRRGWRARFRLLWI